MQSDQTSEQASSIDASQEKDRETTTENTELLNGLEDDTTEAQDTPSVPEAPMTTPAGIMMVEIKNVKEFPFKQNDEFKVKICKMFDYHNYLTFHIFRLSLLKL